MSIYTQKQRIDGGAVNVLPDELKKEIYNSFYPVGAIYTSLSTSGTVPSVTLDDGTEYKGKWENITDRFLMSGSASTIGTTGGASTVTLSESNIPSHSHTKGDIRLTGRWSGWYSSSNAPFKQQNGLFSTTTNNPQKRSYFAGTEDGVKTAACSNLTFSTANGGSFTGNTGYTGSGNAHNNMPLYKQVYIWKRTA